MNYELLRKSITIIEAVPDKNLDLDIVLYHGVRGTCGCAAGWLALDPEFSKATTLGVSHGTLLSYNGEIGHFHCCMAKVFGIDKDTAVELFRARGKGEVGGTDKEVWLARAHAMLGQESRE